MSVFTMSILCLVSLLCLLPLATSFTGPSLHCAVRREINPCTCKHRDALTGSITVVCERMTSFGQVVDALQDRFGNHSIALRIAVSNLDDLPSKTFQELGMRIIHLKLMKNNLRWERNIHGFTWQNPDLWLLWIWFYSPLFSKLKFYVRVIIPKSEFSQVKNYHILGIRLHDTREKIP